jgi:hypothetical protein
LGEEVEAMLDQPHGQNQTVLTVAEARALADAVTTHCTCAGLGSLTRRIQPCGACQILAAPDTICHLLFYRRLAADLRHARHPAAP